jgi:hypothetical protein
MKKIVILALLINLCFSNVLCSDVIGENTYNFCNNECIKNLWGRDKECSECLDMCKKELQKNNPDIAKKIDLIETNESLPSNSCFINLLYKNKKKLIERI